MTREEMRAKIEEVAQTIGTNAEWLDALINFETGGTYSPTIKNPMSSARGLIQITDGAARDIGFDSSLDAVNRYPTFNAQMDNVVLPYFVMQINRHGPLDTKQRLYMSVFYPAYMDNPPDTTFSDSIRAVNPGIDTVQDYVNFVDRRVQVKALVGASSKMLPLLLFAGAGVALYLALRK